MGQQPGNAEHEMRESAENVKSQMSGAAQDFRARMSNVRQDVRELASTAGNMAREQLDPVEDYIRQYPIRAMLIAAGAGMALGMMFRGR